MGEGNKPYDEQIENAHEVIDSGVHDAMCVLAAEKPGPTGTDIEMLMGTDSTTMSSRDNGSVRMEMLLMHFEATSAMLDIPPSNLCDYLINNYGDQNIGEMKETAERRK